MTRAEQYIDNLLLNGTAIIWNQVSGELCPCMMSVDTNRHCYSKSWHDAHPAAEKCEGTGLIQRETVTWNLKTIITLGLDTLKPYINATAKEDIGARDIRELCLLGAVKTGTQQMVDFAEVNKLADTFTIYTMTFRLKHYTLLNDITQVAVVERIEE